MSRTKNDRNLGTSLPENACAAACADPTHPAACSNCGNFLLALTMLIGTSHVHACAAPTHPAACGNCGDFLLALTMFIVTSPVHACAAACAAPTPAAACKTGEGCRWGLCSSPLAWAWPVPRPQTPSARTTKKKKNAARFSVLCSWPGPGQCCVQTPSARTTKNTRNAAIQLLSAVLLAGGLASAVSTGALCTQDKEENVCDD